MAKAKKKETEEVKEFKDNAKAAEEAKAESLAIEAEKKEVKEQAKKAKKMKIKYTGKAKKVVFLGKRFKPDEVQEVPARYKNAITEDMQDFTIVD